MLAEVERAPDMVQVAEERAQLMPVLAVTQYNQVVVGPVERSFLEQFGCLPWQLFLSL